MPIVRNVVKTGAQVAVAVRDLVDVADGRECHERPIDGAQIIVTEGGGGLVQR